MIPSARHWLFVALLVVLLSSASARAAESAPVVTTAAALRPVVQEITVTGSVVSPQVSRLSAEVAGWVTQVHVELGDRVARGATLMTLDDELARINLAASQAATRVAAAALSDARRRLTEAERLSAERTIAETELRARHAEVEIDLATLEQRQADERRAAALLERHTLKAPFAAAVSQRLSHAGEWLQPGTPVVELTATDALRIDFHVPQEFYARVSTGMSPTVELDALPERRLAARILTAVPAGDPQSRSFLLLTRLQDETTPIIAGMSARALLRFETGREGVSVPRDAVLRLPDGRVTVWVARRDDDGVTVEERRVRIGRAFEGFIEIVDGLNAGDEVVVRGNDGLQEGHRVEVLERL